MNERGLFFFLQCRYLHIPHGTLKKAFYCFKLENLKKNVVSCTSFKTTNLLNASILQFIFLIHPRRWKKRGVVSMSDSLGGLLKTRLHLN